MNLVLNIIWILFGGLAIALEYVISSLLMMVTIIGIPFGLQTMKLAVLSLTPFGSSVVAAHDSEGGCLRIVMTVIWWIVGGFMIAVTHVLFGLLFCITIIGIPFGRQHFKLAKLAFTPFGKNVI